MPENIDIEVRLKVVFRKPETAVQRFTGNGKRIQFNVLGEESANIVGNSKGWIFL